jgi:hypothetical protein
MPDLFHYLLKRSLRFSKVANSMSVIYHARSHQDPEAMSHKTCLTTFQILLLSRSYKFAPSSALSSTPFGAFRMTDVSFFVGLLLVPIVRCGYGHSQRSRGSHRQMAWAIFFSLCLLGAFAAGCVWVFTGNQTAYLYLLGSPWTNGAVIEVCRFSLEVTLRTKA